MNAKDKDELLIRLDEKTNNILHAVEKIERHLAELNKKVEKHAIDIGINKKIVGGIVSAITAILLRVLGVY